MKNRTNLSEAVVHNCPSGKNSSSLHNRCVCRARCFAAWLCFNISKVRCDIRLVALLWEWQRWLAPSLFNPMCVSFAPRVYAERFWFVTRVTADLGETETHPLRAHIQVVCPQVHLADVTRRRMPIVIFVPLFGRNHHHPSISPHPRNKIIAPRRSCISWSTYFRVVTPPRLDARGTVLSVVPAFCVSASQCRITVWDLLLFWTHWMHREGSWNQRWDLEHTFLLLIYFCFEWRNVFFFLPALSFLMKVTGMKSDRFWTIDCVFVAIKVADRGLQVSIRPGVSVCVQQRKIKHVTGLERIWNLIGFVFLPADTRKKTEKLVCCCLRCCAFPPKVFVAKLTQVESKPHSLPAVTRRIFSITPSVWCID